MRKLNESDVKDIIGTVNAGYEIIAAKINSGTFADSDSYGTVLAQNRKDNYVTWQFHFVENNRPTFYWGHYFSNLEDVTVDFAERGC